MGCGDEKLSKDLTQTFTAHCNAMICQQVTLLGDAEWPKVADAVIEATTSPCTARAARRVRAAACRPGATAAPAGVAPLPHHAAMEDHPVGAPGKSNGTSAP